jgi:superfamily I DNA/RNA helicase
LGSGNTGRTLVFYDPSQTIFGEPSHVPEFPTITLNRNFRNTRCIAEVVSKLGRMEMRSFERCPEGEPPNVRKQEAQRRSLAQMADLLKRLVKDDRVLPDQITILTPHTRNNSLFSNLEELGGYPLASNPTDRAGAILHTTIGAFKGLESEVIILADINPEDPLCNLNARYVAASRARHRLYVFAKGDWLG